MSNSTFLKGPNIVHPEKPSAVGSRNSLVREDRSEYKESQLVIDEEVDKILNHINSKLPPEVLSRLNVGGNVKEVLHNYFNQAYQNMYNRYITTVEDEMSKKFRDLVDREESITQKKYTPRGIGELLVDIGGEDKFNSSEIEKGVVNVYSHLQGHLQKSIGTLESDTNAILRQKSDIGAVVRGDNAYSVVKCSVSNDLDRPENVNDVVLSINVLDEEFHSKLFHYQVMTEAIIRDLVSERVMEAIDDEINRINESLVDAGKSEMSTAEAMFEKIRLSESHLADEITTDKAGKKIGKYAIAKESIYKAIEGVAAEFKSDDFDPLALREQVQHVVDDENVRNRGFNTAINSLTSILDGSKLPYQHIENFKNKRLLVIRENKYLDKKELPDENYEIEMVYFDQRQLQEHRIAYQQQIVEFQAEVDQLSRIVHRMYDHHFKNLNQNLDYQDLVKQYTSSAEADDGEFSDYADQKFDAGIWAGLLSDDVVQTEVEDQHPSFNAERKILATKMRRMLEKLQISFGSQYPAERVSVESRLSSLNAAIADFYKRFNPFHVQPGLVLMFRLSTIKRKQTTLRAVGDVLNEFLYKISKGFADPAFANFKRRRSIDGKLNSEIKDVALS